MSDFDMGFTLDGTSYTLKGRAGERQWVSRVAGPCEPNEYSVQWKVRIVDETHRRVAMYRPTIGGRTPKMRALTMSLDAIAHNTLRWNDLIETDDPRLQ